MSRKSPSGYEATIQPVGNGSGRGNGYGYGLGIDYGDACGGGYGFGIGCNNAYGDGYGEGRRHSSSDGCVSSYSQRFSTGYGYATVCRRMRRRP